jgi:hypothetical protein
MQPSRQTPPPILYKYFAPQRFHVLNDCRVRFSQRTVFEDDHELQPDYAIFGTASEIWRYAISVGFPLARKGLSASVMVQAMASSSRAQKIAIDALKSNVRSLDQVGVFCLTEASDNDRMWDEYAKDCRGFVLGFDTTHVGFSQLIAQGRLGEVNYSDQPIGSALASLWDGNAVGALFRKRLKYAFEREWRIIRMLHRLERGADDVFLSPFDPSSVREIIIRPECDVGSDLHQLAAKDDRYKHLRITIQGKSEVDA